MTSARVSRGVCLRVTLDALTFVWWNLLWCIFPISAVKPCFVSSQGRRVLNTVGITCILGLSSTFMSLPILSNQEDIIPSGFRSRALLSTADATGIKVNYQNHKIECYIFFSLCNTTFPLCRFRHLPRKRLLVFPLAQYHRCCTCVPGFPRCTLMWVRQSGFQAWSVHRENRANFPVGRAGLWAMRAGL